MQGGRAVMLRVMAAQLDRHIQRGKDQRISSSSRYPARAGGSVLPRYEPSLCRAENASERGEGSNTSRGREAPAIDLS